MDPLQDRFGIEALAELGGVSRRSVRYYIQEGLLPAPLGVGRGHHYDRSHLDRLLQVKAWQETGLSLGEIRARLAGPPDAHASELPPPDPVPRSAWRRLTLAPGVELHVAAGITLPPSRRIDELAAWCRQHLSRGQDFEE